MKWTTIGAILLVLIAFSVLAQSVSAEQIIVNEKDEYLCITTAGYLWSNEQQARVTPLEGPVGRGNELVITPMKTGVGSREMTETSATDTKLNFSSAFSETKAKKSNNPLQVVTDIVAVLQGFFAQFV